MAEKVIEKINEQQNEYKAGHPAITVGEHLKYICKHTPGAAELVLRDLDVPDMNIGKCEEKIRELANKRHKENGGDFAFVSPEEADGIIREFYGITDENIAQQVDENSTDKVNINFDELFA